jgi:hypothetical protein
MSTGHESFVSVKSEEEEEEEEKRNWEISS